ncbi:hypothetical protein F2Q69_00038125 [Brassica cretica]|uniref:Uncharacterized protein n=1 Tax=Brassica cretica TaxID=69181 RepID=A0A8S9SI45_BRACR|nr:hypothetical protein F2Q69_00038125 [Brassica cretica]
MQQSTSSGQNATIVFTMQPLQRPKGSSKTLTGSSGTQSLQGRSVGNSETISDSIGDDETIHQRLCIGDDETIHQRFYFYSQSLCAVSDGSPPFQLRRSFRLPLKQLCSSSMALMVNAPPSSFSRPPPDPPPYEYPPLEALSPVAPPEPPDPPDVVPLVPSSDSPFPCGRLFPVVCRSSPCQAVKIHNQQETMRGNPRVVVATSVNPKMVGRTRHWAYTSISTAKVESLSIAELNNFVTTAPSQEIDFVCTGRVTGIKMEKEWCYVSCSNCDKKL